MSAQNPVDPFAFDDWSDAAASQPIEPPPIEGKSPIGDVGSLIGFGEPDTGPDAEASSSPVDESVDVSKGETHHHEQIAFAESSEQGMGAAQNAAADHDDEMSIGIEQPNVLEPAGQEAGFQASNVDVHEVAEQKPTDIGEVASAEESAAETVDPVAPSEILEFGGPDHAEPSVEKSVAKSEAVVVEATVGQTDADAAEDELAEALGFGWGSETEEKKPAKTLPAAEVSRFKEDVDEEERLARPAAAAWEPTDFTRGAGRGKSTSPTDDGGRRKAGPGGYGESEIKESQGPVAPSQPRRSAIVRGQAGLRPGADAATATLAPSKILPPETVVRSLPKIDLDAFEEAVTPVELLARPHEADLYAEAPEVEDRRPTRLNDDDDQPVAPSAELARQSRARIVVEREIEEDLPRPKPATAKHDTEESMKRKPWVVRSIRNPWVAAAATLLVCCTGYSASMLFDRRADAPVEKKPIPAVEEMTAHAAPEPENTANLQNDLAGIDQMIREGRYGPGRDACTEALAKTGASESQALQYRLGLCLEGLDRLDESLDVFRKVTTRFHDTPAGRASQLGQARVWLRMRKPTEAKGLLGDLLLHAAQPGLRDHPLLGDAYHLLALALTLETTSGDLPGPSADRAVVAHPLADLPVELMLDWVSAEEASKPVEGGNEGPVVVRRLGPRPDDLTVTVGAHFIPVYELLDAIGRQAHLRVVWTPEARQQVAGRTVTVSVDQMPLPELMRAIAAESDLFWDLTANALTLSSVEQTPEKQRATLRLTAARRALRDAIVTYPDHPLIANAYLELGNLEAVDGHLKDAIAWYERLLREMPRSAVALETHFNLGLAQTRAGDAAAAREAFYWVADRSPGHELAPLSYLKIGRLFLEENDPTAALRALRRAQSAVPGTPTHAAAALLLAAAHLMTNNPRAAHAALAEDEEALNRPPFRQAAAVLDGLARYRAVSDPKKAMREASELLTALMSYREDSVLGPVGLVLAGQGFRDIGMNEEMTAVYQKALPTMHGGLALEMSADLADHYFTLGQYQAARPLFESVAKQPGKRVASAELRLAEIDLREHHPDECLKRCRMLLKEGQTAELDTTLKLMGQAHAERGEHALAARCFAGELPKP